MSRELSHQPESRSNNHRFRRTRQGQFSPRPTPPPPRKATEFDFSSDFDESMLPNFDDVFTKIQSNVEDEIKRDFQGWSMPEFHNEEKEDKKPDGVADVSNDLRPNRYRDDVLPDYLDWQMPSHEELQENYKTIVTSGSEDNIQLAPWSSQKLNPEKKH